MIKCILLGGMLLLSEASYCWGFFGHRKINQHAVFLLPPEMLVLYKKHVGFLEEHSVDPDKRRYVVAEEGPRHYIDIDHYGHFDSLPRKWKDAVAKYTADTLQKHGIVPWWLQTMLGRLTTAFKEKDPARILKYSAEIGHYIADAHVPLHATKNHNGQYTGQKGIHGFWESRIPELLADREWDFFIGKAAYIKNPADFVWARVIESARAADTVLKYEKALSQEYPPDRRFAFEERNGQLVRQYASGYTKKYNEKLKGMVERRMRQSIFAVASFWYTAWINAGQPDLQNLVNPAFSAEDQKEFDELTNAWKKHGTIEHEH
jgi:hypothetical protein